MADTASPPVTDAPAPASPMAPSPSATPGPNGRRLRVLVHDYSGHPFQVQLSRALAGRSHDVLHVHCSSYQTGKGAVHRREGDPATLGFEAIDLGRVFNRYAVHRRVPQELRYGARFARVAAAYRPDVILSTNDPLFAKARSAYWCRRSGTPWVFWLQDIYSVAMSGYVSARLGPAGRVLGHGFQALERSLLRGADAVVPISDHFEPVLETWGVPASRRHVIENWAPLDELEPGPKDNPWAREHDLHDKTVFLYAGTLGIKHNPRLLLALGERFASRPNVAVLVVSEGRGADWLASALRTSPLTNVVLLPYQPFDRLPEVFATADVLLGLLSRDAGTYSVPSKVLSYLCAGRPVLAAIPEGNPAARTVAGAGAGIVVDCDDEQGFLVGAEKLLADPALRRHHGHRARAHAERAFNIDTIADRFEAILLGAAVRR
ncbi:MAG: glycosyltransferase family 4 protein [Acidimicrobiales bacterium]